MELGIHPFVTAGMVMQLLAGAKIIEVNMENKEEKSMFDGAQKLMAVIISLCQSFAYVWSGMYGSLEDIGAGNGLLIIIQLTFDVGSERKLSGSHNMVEGLWFIEDRTPFYILHNASKFTLRFFYCHFPSPC